MPTQERPPATPSTAMSLPESSSPIPSILLSLAPTRSATTSTDLSGNSAARVTRAVVVQAQQGTGGGGGGATGLAWVLLLAFATLLSRLNPNWRLRSKAS